VRRALALAAGVLLAGLLLFGSATDLGVTRLPVATAMLLLACGAGAMMRGGLCALSRRRDAVALALAVLFRGLLVDALLAWLPGGVRSAWMTVAFVTLVPAGLLLGRLLRGALDGAFSTSLIGVCLGALVVGFGGLGLLPAWLTVPLSTVLIWWLARRPEACDMAPAGATEPDLAERLPGSGHAGLLLGAALSLVALCFRRVVPAYASPTAHPGLDVLLVLALPAAMVAWPAGVLARGRATRWLGASGGLFLCAAAWVTADSLGLYENSAALVSLTRMFHGRALQAGGLVADWHVWLISFAGAVAASLGMASGAVRGTRAAAGALLGAGLAQLAEFLLIAPQSPLATNPSSAPLRLLLGAASCGALLLPVFLFGRKGWFALPLAALPFLSWQPEAGAPWFSTESLRQVAGFDEVRRPGEYSAECFERGVATDVTVFSTPGAESRALEGRDAYTQTLSARTPPFSLGPDGEFRAATAEAHTHAAFHPGAHDEEGVQEPVPTPAPADVPLERFYGVRVAGRALHRQHVPTGAEGSVGRLTRLFAVPGRVLACGIGAELLAADLHDSGQARSAQVASATPLGHSGTRLVLDHLGSGGWQAAKIEDPAISLRGTQPGSIDTLLVAPAEESLPGVAELVTLESVERMRRLLAPGGRCLLWLDTAELGARELRARLASFGAVFGDRSAALVEPRELDPPFVLLLGWVDDAGRLSRRELEGRLTTSEATGFRTQLRRVEDLAALLLCDGRGLSELADSGPLHARARPICSVAGSESGWAAVAAVAGEAPSLEAMVAGAGPARSGEREVFAGLATHSRYAYRLLGLNDTLLEIKPDVEWSSFDAEVASYVRAAEQDPDDPLLQLALAALLEPLAVVGDLTRFATVYEACRAERMKSWRLALQEAWVRKESLQLEQSAEAVERARRWAAGD